MHFKGNLKTSKQTWQNVLPPPIERNTILNSGTSAAE